MKLLLTHGYFVFEDPKELQVMKPYVPLGLLYLSAHLRNRGFDVEIYDSTFGSKQELFSIIAQGPPAALGIYANLMTRVNVLEIARFAKQAGWMVIAGGPEPSNYPEEYLSHGIDVIVDGEGELSLESLLHAAPDHLERDRSAWGSISGLSFRGEDGQLVRTGPATLLTNLDAQPWPDRERIDMDRYLTAWRNAHGRSSVSLITARGCPYRCNWCSHSVYGTTHRRRSPQSVVNEIEWIRTRYNPDMVWIADDVFTIHHGWLKEFSSEMKNRNLAIPFECITRADRVNDQVADMLAELHCFRVWIGSESGSQRILDAMQRGVSTAQVQSAVRSFKSRGIETGMFLMWGYEGEEIEDIEQTVEHVKRCGPDACFTTVSYPIKGTPYYEKVAKRLVHISGWNQRTDRDIRITGRHSRQFYKHADELLRSELSNAPDALRTQAAREALWRTRFEVEA